MAGNELALQGGGISASTVSEALTPTLEAILLNAANSGDAAKKIQAVPALVEEAKSQLPVVERLSAPTDPAALYKIMQKLWIANLSFQPEFGTDEDGKVLQRAWFDVYAEALCPLPAEALQIAVDEWLRQGKGSWPQASDIYKLAEKEAQEIRLIAWRLRKAVFYTERDSKPPPTADDRAKALALLEEMRGPTGRVSLAKIAANNLPQ